MLKVCDFLRKGTKGAKRDRRGFSNFPFRPLRPLRPFQRSCRLEQAKQTQTLRAALPQFLVRRGQICSIAKEDPRGIVQEVQPVGSYFWDGTKMLPLITRNLLAGHNSQNHRISMHHRITTNVCEVTDRLIYIVIDDTLNRLNTAVIHRHNSRDHSC